MTSKEFGRYSQNPKDAHREYEQSRTAVTRQIGPYVLTLDPGYSLWVPSMTDGSPVPRALSGRFTDIAAFASALNLYEAQRKVAGNGA